MLKRIAMILGFVINIFSSTANAQESPQCGVQSNQPYTQIGGAYCTASGTVKALFIFIDFTDDSFEPTNGTWPVGTGPNYLNNIVDLTEGQNSGIYENVSTYFNNQSYGQFKMIGKAYYVQAPHPLSYYQSVFPGNEIAYSSRDAIQTLDVTVDFSDYDRWISNYYSHSTGSDGKVDMVFFCYRRMYGQAYEGWQSASLPGDVYVDGGARRIGGDQTVDVLNMINYPDWGRSMQNVLHEFGHVWGLNHLYAPGTWAIMGQRTPSTASFMNAIEKEQLGWISFNTITTTTTFTLPDFGSTGTVYRVQIPGTSEYYILENHQKLTMYDVPDKTSGGQGLYILHNASGISSPSQGDLKIVNADGRWNWDNPNWIQNPWSPDPNFLIPVFRKTTINPIAGQTDRNLLYAVHPVSGIGDDYFINAWIDNQSGQTITGTLYFGDGKDSWNLTNNTVFSPWSNPATTKSDNTITNIAIETQTQSGSVLTIKVYMNDPQLAAPSKPQNISVESYGGSRFQPAHPKINWNANQEPDMQVSGAVYEIYRYAGTSGPSLIATVPYNQTNYVDNIVNVGSGGLSIYYKVKAKDTQNLSSVFSDVVTIGSSNFQEKRQQPIEQMPVKMEISQNFPNPFNPSTTIRYTITDGNFTSLKLYNMLGQEVAQIVNEYKNPGYYSVELNASNLPSGIYLYKLVSGNNVALKKMTLMK